MARRIPKKISKGYLENAALHYLQRYATSCGNLRRVLARKIDRSCRHHGDDPAAFAPVLDDLVARYVTSGLLNDAVYAQAKTASLRRQGKSRQAITAKLRAKGLEPPDITDALSAIDANHDEADKDAELQAALTLARRKKLGAFRSVPCADLQAQRREMAVLARAGFSFDTARRALCFSEDIE